MDAPPAGPMDEKELETGLCDAIRAGHDDRGRLASLALHRSTSNAQSLGELIGAAHYEVIQDHSRSTLGV